VSDPDKPQEQANTRVSPISGTAPPAEHRWAPGQSGNPGGRPKGQSITARLRALLDAQAVDAKGAPIPGLTIGDQIAQALAREAASGDVKAIKEYCDRTEGRPRPVQPESGEDEAREAWDDVCDAVESENPPGADDPA
jgi:hypothetical protein